MPQGQCLGIRVRDGPLGLVAISFIAPEGGVGERFNLPIRCKGVIEEEDGVLCPKCKKCLDITNLAEKTGTSIKGGRTQYLNGIVGQPIPYWSHLVGSTWYLEKLKAGYKISEEGMVKVRAAIERAYGKGGVPPAEPYPGTAAAAAETGANEVVGPKKGRRIAIKRPRAPASAAAAAPAAKQVTLDPFVEPVATPKAPPPPPPMTEWAGPITSTATRPASPPLFFDPAKAPLEVSDVIRRRVKKHVIEGGREVRIDTEKGKVYDLKAHYIGRWNAASNSLISYPDSD